MQGKVVQAKQATERGPGDTPRLRSSPQKVASRLIAVSALSLTLASCGGASSSNKPSASQSDSSGTDTVTTPVSKAAASTKATSTQTAAAHHVPIDEKVEISSPAFAPDGVIPVRYTCDGSNTPPPLRWGGIPAGTAELALYVIKLEPVDGHLVFGWAVAGIDPKSHGLQDGKLPAGAVTGLNSNGEARYDVCPPKGKKEAYVTVLLALPRSQHPKQNFDATAQRLKDLHEAEYEGFLVFKYSRH